MVKIQFFPLDIRRAEYNNKQAVLLFGRTLTNQRVCIIDDSYIPYFYVIPKKGINVREKLEKIEVERDKVISRVMKTELVKKKLSGRETEAIKVYVPFYRDIRAVKSVIDEWEIIEGIYNHDIPYLRKYLADKGFVISNLLEAEAEPVNAGYKVDTFIAGSITMSTEETIKSPRILAFSIETYNPGMRIDMKNNPIIMLSFYGESFKKVFTWKHFKTDLDYIEFVNSEADIIEKFAETIEGYRPDIIVGYNTDNFDFPYIDERAKKYRIALNIALDNSGLRLVRGENKRALIAGIAHIDAFRYVKTLNISGGYSLSKVAMKLLGKEKKEVNLENLYKIWDQGKEDIGKYCEYCLFDSELAYDLCKKFMPNIIELSKITGLTIDNITRFGYSQIVESFLMRRAHNLGELVPNRPDKTEMAKRFLGSYKGGFVFEPKPGIYDNVIVFDFRSLYPTIIVSHNISPDTIDCGCCGEETNIAPEDTETLHHFCKNKKGFLPLILEDLITRRTRIKEMLKEDNIFLNARAENLKLLANSFYGYLGFYAARWYSIDTARAITAWGRHYIKQVIDKADKEGFSVIYSDTDSIFMVVENKIQAFEFMEKINAMLPGLMELEFEGLYKRSLFVAAKEKSAGAKKKYALLSRDGTVKIRGFESVRKNWSAVGSEAQRKVIHLILKSGNAKGAMDYLQDVIDSLSKKEVENTKTIIETTLQKNIDSYDSLAPHVSVAKTMRDKGIDVRPGTKIRYIVVEGEGRINERARLPEDVEEGSYDSEYYINNQIIPAVEKIFELFGYKKDDLYIPKGQKKLEDF